MVDRPLVLNASIRGQPNTSSALHASITSSVESLTQSLRYTDWVERLSLTFPLWICSNNVHAPSNVGDRRKACCAFFTGLLQAHQNR